MLQIPNYKFIDTYNPKKLDTEYIKNFSIVNLSNIEPELTDNNLYELINVLEQLSNVDIVDVSTIRKYISNIYNNTHIYVVKYENKIIGTGKLLIEDKIIHNFGKVAHIEDIVIDTKYRGLGLAKNLMNKLIDISKKHNCYKIILDASNDIKPFYEKLGFKHHANSMRFDINYKL